MCPFDRTFLSLFFILLCLSFAAPGLHADGCSEGDSPPPQIIVPHCGEQGGPPFDDSQWTPDPEPSYLTFFAGDRFWIVPGQNIVYRLPQSQEAEARRLLVGAAAHGSSATAVVRTASNGDAILIDVGNNARRAVHEFQLKQLMAGMNVSRITHIHITHAHSDHVNRLYEAVRQYRVPARNVVLPPLHTSYAQSLINTLNRLAQDFPNLGYRPLSAEFLRSNVPSHYLRSRGGNYYVARFQQGGASITYIANPRSFERLAAFANSGGNVPSHLIDSAAPMIKIQRIGDPNAMVVMGDWRGTDILEIRDRMERERRGSFAEFFSNVDLLKGLQHHVGVVRNARDVEGILELLKVTSFARGRLNVLVQSDTNSDICRGQMRPKLVEALAWLGVRVTVTLKGDTAIASHTTASTAGDATVAGPAVHQFNLPAADQARIERMIEKRAELARWQRSYQLNSEILKTIFGKEVTETLGRAMERNYRRVAELSQANNPVESLLTGPAGNRRMNDNANIPTAQLRRNVEEILTRHNEIRNHLELAGMLETFNMLQRAAPVQYEIFREIRERLRGARGSSARMVELMETINPRVRRDLLRRRANRGAVHHELRNALIQNRIFAAGGGGTSRVRATSGAAILIAGELSAMALDYYHFQREAREGDLGEQFSVLEWWLERGAVPRFVGWVDEIDLTGRDYRTTGYDQLVRLRDSGDLDGIELAMPDTEEAWGGFYFWATAHIRSYDDYADHFVHAPHQVVAHYHTGGASNFPNGDWRYRQLTWDRTARTSSGARGERWVSSAHLNTIMQDVMTRALAQTEETLAKVWASREPARPAPTGPSIGPDHHAISAEALETAYGAHVSTMRPTGRTRFKEGADRTLYSHFDKDRVVMESDEWWTSDPYFFVFENYNAPAGYVLVAGADYNTYAAIRSSKVYQFDNHYDIHVSYTSTDGGMNVFREPTYSMRDSEGVMRSYSSDEEVERIENMIAAVNNSPKSEYETFSMGENRGVYRLWFDGPNHWAVGLIEKSELQPVGTFEAPTEEERASLATGRIVRGFQAPTVTACPRHTDVSAPDESVDFDGDCGRIDCDCNNIDSGIVTREYRQECREREDEIKLHCEITGELLGSCHPTASGPAAWP